MARGQQRAQQRSQEELDDSSEQALLAAAMGATEDEIFREAMGDAPDDNDGDRSLEDIGDELGDAEDEDEPAGDGELDPALARTGHEDAPEDDEVELDADGNPIEPVERDQFEQPRPARLPSWARPADPQDGMLPLLADIQTRLTRMEQPRQQQQQQPRQEEVASDDIDPIVDPVGFRAAVRRETQQMVEASQQQGRLASSFNNMHSAYEENDRGPEFVYAANALDRLTKSAANHQGDREIVQSIVNARDPGRALMEWAEEALDLQTFRDQNDPIVQIADRYGVDPETARAFFEGQQQQRPERQNDRQGARRTEQSPPAGRQRSEQRGAPLQRQQQRAGGRRLPSLNGASSAGSGRREGGNRNLDMRGMDGSEDAIFQYALS